MTANPPISPGLGDPLPQPASPEVLAFLARRRSASALTLAGPGPDEAEVRAIIGLAARVPDHGKLAPWRFVVLAGAAKAAFAARLEAIAQARDDALLAAKLGKLKTPPVGIAVISSPRIGTIPEWEQVLSAGAVCTTLLQAATAKGFGANWITDWYSYDAEAMAALGLVEGERIAGFVFLGHAAEPPLERERPDVDRLISRWTP
jgi:nitroreductase